MHYDLRLRSQIGRSAESGISPLVHTMQFRFSSGDLQYHIEFVVTFSAPSVLALRYKEVTLLRVCVTIFDLIHAACFLP